MAVPLVLWTRHGQEREHLLPDWLAGVGLDPAPVLYQAGWLNRLPQSLGDGRPLRQ